MSGVVRLSEEQGGVLLIASDGLWDVAEVEAVTQAVVQADRWVLCYFLFPVRGGAYLGRGGVGRVDSGGGQYDAFQHPPGCLLLTSWWVGCAVRNCMQGLCRHPASDEQLAAAPKPPAASSSSLQ